MGALWVNYWFWRTKEQKEVDFIEEADGKITAYEFSFSIAYPNSIYKVINPQNFEDFIL